MADLPSLLIRAAWPIAHGLGRPWAASDRDVVTAHRRRRSTCDVPAQTGPRPTLLVKSRGAIFNARRLSVTSGIYMISLAFKRSMQDCFSTRSCLNQPSHDLLDARG